MCFDIEKKREEGEDSHHVEVHEFKASIMSFTVAV